MTPIHGNSRQFHGNFTAIQVPGVFTALYQHCLVRQFDTASVADNACAAVVRQLRHFFPIISDHVDQFPRVSVPCRRVRVRVLCPPVISMHIGC